jgi:hypothetical protein
VVLLVVALATSGGSRATNATPQPLATTAGSPSTTTSSANGSRPTVPAGPPASKIPPPIAATKDAAAAKTADNADLPNWTVPAELESELGAEVACGIFKMRLLNGYWPTSRTAHILDSLDYGWKGPEEPGKVTPMVAIGVLDLPRNVRDTLETMMVRSMDHLRRQFDSFTWMPSERGRISGLTFARARWSGVAKPTGGKPALAVHGVNYMAVTRDRNTAISGLALAGTPDTLKRAEALILSFRLVVP